MKRRRPEDLGPHERDEHAGKLADDLQGVLDAVGRQHYARSTARDFAKGGKYNPRPRRRYAIT